MRIPLASLILAALCVPAASLAAQNPVVGTLTCMSGGNSVFSAAVYYAAIQKDYPGFGITTSGGVIVTDIAVLGPLVAASLSRTIFDTCTLSNGSASITLAQVSVAGVIAEGQGANVLQEENFPLPLLSSVEAYELPVVNPLPQTYAYGSFDYQAISTSGLESNSSEATLTTLADALRLFAAKLHASQAQNRVAGGAQ